MQRAAITLGGIVENIIILGEAEDSFDPGEDRQLVALAEDSPVSLGWSFDGSDFSPPPSLEVAVPEAVTSRQARLALLGAGLLAKVEQTLSDLPGVQGEAARIEWEYALEIRRDSALIGAIAPMLGMTGAQIDALFVAGQAL